MTDIHLTYLKIREKDEKTLLLYGCNRTSYSEIGSSHNAKRRNWEWLSRSDLDIAIRKVSQIDTNKAIWTASAWWFVYGAWRCLAWLQLACKWAIWRRLERERLEMSDPTRSTSTPDLSLSSHQHTSTRAWVTRLQHSWRRCQNHHSYASAIKLQGTKSQMILISIN